MEIKKSEQKVAPKRKPSAVAKPEPQKPVQTVDIEQLPKVKSETDYKTQKETESIKQKREQMFKDEQVRQTRIKAQAIIARKNMRVFQITLIVTLALLLIFAPIYSNQNFKVKELDYLTMDDIQIDHPLGDYFSPYQYLRYKRELETGSPFIKSVKLKYNMKKMQVVVDITEYKPLAKDVENNVFFYEDDEVVKESDLNLYAPVISGFNQKNLAKLLKNMQTLDYDVIMQIDTIEYVGTEDDPDLLKLGMDGDHTVFIDMEQMKNKLPYYNQIKQIIDDKADGKPGIIHLELGDYYEPK